MRVSGCWPPLASSHHACGKHSAPALLASTGLVGEVLQTPPEATGCILASMSSPRKTPDRRKQSDRDKLSCWRSPWAGIGSVHSIEEGELPAQHRSPGSAHAIGPEHLTGSAQAMGSAATMGSAPTPGAMRLQKPDGRRNSPPERHTPRGRRRPWGSSRPRGSRTAQLWIGECRPISAPVKGSSKAIRSARPSGWIWPSGRRKPS